MFSVGQLHAETIGLPGFYERLSHDPVKEYQQVLKTAVKQMIQANALPASAKNLILQTPRTSRFYLLPKIHKENIPLKKGTVPKRLDLCYHFGTFYNI